MRASVSQVRALLVLLLTAGVACLSTSAEAQDDTLPRYLRDRGSGVTTSIFGTYIRRGQLLLHPFFEYTIDDNREYQPDQFGLGPDLDFRGKYRASEGVLFIGYGLTDWLALEVEASVISARLDKSPIDTFPTPARIEESGFGDIEGQLRARVMRESSGRPEVFSYVEITAPSQKNKLLIVNPDWDLKFGLGLIKGFSWGTMTFRGTVEYNREETHVDLGEFSLEYLKRLSRAVRIFLAVEGGESGSLDEWELVSGVHLRISDLVLLRLTNSYGLASKSTDWAPQIGLVFAFPH